MCLWVAFAWNFFGIFLIFSVGVCGAYYLWGIQVVQGLNISCSMARRSMQETFHDHDTFISSCLRPISSLRFADDIWQAAATADFRASLGQSKGLWTKVSTEKSRS